MARMEHTYLACIVESKLGSEERSAILLDQDVHVCGYICGYPNSTMLIWKLCFSCLEFGNASRRTWAILSFSFFLFFFFFSGG